MSIISNSPSKVDLEAIEKIKKWLKSTIDEDDLNKPININSLARKTRRIAYITPRNNQPHFEEYILKPLEKEGYCEINAEKREVIFLKLFN
jgi:hypothetical protein